MALPEHLIPVVKRIEALPVSAPPSPWRLTVQSGIGGLTDVGFGPDTELLLVVSSQGRGVFDCTTGERVARDGDVETDFHDASRMLADGIGPLNGISVPMAGLNGGGLSGGTSDGWTVDDFTLEWPHHTLLLNGPFSWPYNINGQLWKLGAESELRAFGFSTTGLSLVIATSSDVIAWSRPSA